MSKTVEGRIVLTIGEEISRANIIDGGIAVEILLSASESDEKKRVKKVQPGTKEFEEMFPIVDIENVSLEDQFMQYDSISDYEKRVKENIIKAKKIGMKNFRKPVMDPSFADDGETIIYCAGEKPAINKSPHWWDKNAPKFMPEKNSRLIDDLQKDVWLGILIKELVDNGYEVTDAWKNVCVDSTDLGLRWDLYNVNRELERTGSRQIGKWFDLGNTLKIVKKHEASDFLLFGCYHDFISWGRRSFHPLANTIVVNAPLSDHYRCVGELVLDV